MKNQIKNTLIVGARCSRPGACNAPLRVLSCLLLVVFLSGCKINLSIFSEDEDDQVVAASGNFDCTTAGGDCAQQYVNAIEDCDGYGVNGNDTWEELPNCTAVEAEGSVTEVFAAIPDDGNQFEGWGNLCWVGSDFCVFTISGEDAASEDEGTIEASFGGEIIPKPVDQYTYNHLGQRQSKTVTVDSVTTTTYFVYDPEGHLIGEYDESGNTIREYVWLEGNLLAQYDYTEGATEPAMNYYANDHLGTPVFMASRDPQQNYNLTTGPFGERYGEFKAAGITQNIRFPGQHYEEETGYNQNWHRDYDPSTGRYLQSDPIGLAGGDVNIYSYVGQNPVMWVDPEGKFNPVIVIGAASFIGGVGVGAVNYRNGGSFWDGFVVGAASTAAAGLAAMAGATGFTLAGGIAEISGAGFVGAAATEVVLVTADLGITALTTVEQAIPDEPSKPFSDYLDEFCSQNPDAPNCQVPPDCPK